MHTQFFYHYFQEIIMQFKSLFIINSFKKNINYECSI